MTPRILPILCAMLLPTIASSAEPPTEAADREKLIGQPVAVDVMPAKIDMKGPRAVTQLVVTGKYADGTVRDLTSVAEFKPSIRTRSPRSTTGATWSPSGPASRRWP